jgi:flagellar capping protein FliD
MEGRATAYRAQLEAQFMALEQMMTQIQGQGAYLSSQIASLNNNNYRK